MALAVKGVGKYRVKTKKHGWLEYVTGYDIKDAENGYAGWEHSPIVAVDIPSKTYKAQVRYRGQVGFTGYKPGSPCGNGKDPIDAIRIVRA